MPKQAVINRARADARAGKKPTTQAGEFIKDEMHRLKRGTGTVHSRKQAIAIGLSEARRAGVKLRAPSGPAAPVRRKAARDTAIGQGRVRPSPTRSAGARKAARTRARQAA